MKKALLVVTVLCLGSSMLYAQDKPRFSSLNYVGLVEGEQGHSLQLQSINGWRYQGWYGGVGAGLDYYYERSVPVFLSLGKFLREQGNSIYLNGDAGIHFAWPRKNGMTYNYYAGDYNTSLYWAGGLGYRIAFRNREESILLNFGYTYKHLRQEAEVVQPCLVPPCPVFKETYDYRLRRLSFKVGFML